MPKGEHFKKPNPRNFQVSFKVNQTELDQLKKITSDAGVSIPEWLRSHITGDAVVVSTPVKTNGVATKKESKPAAKKAIKPEVKKPVTPSEAAKRNYEPDEKPQQMSLF